VKIKAQEIKRIADEAEAAFNYVKPELDEAER